jgi:hypothetical protein
MNHYDHRLEWKDNKPGWYEVFIPNHEIDIIPSDKIISILKWICDHVDNYAAHARWRATKEGISVKFRYERDYIRFSLVWE